MKKILVIDDESNILLMVSQRLKIHGYEVITALSGDQGLERALQDNPDLVLLDHVMPDMDGAEILERLKRERRTCHIPVIMFTANIKEVKVEDYIEKGAVDCIYKPFHPEELLGKIKKFLGIKA